VSAKEFLLAAQTYFCDSRSRSSQFISHQLSAPQPLTKFLACSRSDISSNKMKNGPIFIQLIALSVFITIK